MPPLTFKSTYKIPHPHVKSVDALRERLEYVEHEAREYRGTIRPCGKGTIGFAPRKKLLKTDEQYESNSVHVRGIHYQDVDERTHEFTDTSTYVPQNSLPLVPHLPCQKSQPVAAEKRRASVLTTRGKKYIEDACFLLERKFGVSGLGFYTLTLSLDNEEDISVFNSRAATILKRYLEKIKRHYERLGQRFVYVGVWELHPSRSARCGYPVLHFHYIAPIYRGSSKEFICTPSKIRDTWTSSVKTGTGVEFVRDCRIGCEILRKSASGYLSKYMSKGKPGDADSQGYTNTVSLSSWYSLSRHLLTVISKSRTPVGEFIRSDNTGDGIGGFINDYTVEHGLIKKIINGIEVVLGYWFVASPYFHGCLLVAIDAMLSEML